MRILLDTHTFLWFCMGSSKLSSTSRSLIEEMENTRFLSMVSIWEMAIKLGLGKLQISQPFDKFVIQQLEMNSIQILPIKLNHVFKISTLPWHHRDPFDRMLVAQSLIEDIPIMSADVSFLLYDIKKVW